MVSFVGLFSLWSRGHLTGKACHSEATPKQEFPTRPRDDRFEADTFEVRGNEMHRAASGLNGGGWSGSG